MKTIKKLGFTLIAVAFLLALWTLAILMIKWIVSTPVKTAVTYYGIAGIVIAVKYVMWTAIRDRNRKNRRLPSRRLRKRAA